MKKTYLIMILLLCFSCAVKKQLFQRQDIGFLLKKNICELSIPDDWTSFRDVHNFLFYTPKKLMRNNDNNSVSVYRFTNIGEKTLEYVAEKEIELFNKNHNIKVENSEIKQSKFGKTIVFKINQYWESTKYIKELRFFKFKNSVYVFQYMSIPTFFDFYLEDANSIYDSITIRK